MSKVLIVYHSFGGNTEKMAVALAAGAGEVEGVEVAVKKAAQTTGEELASADALAFGAPNTFGGMAGALRELFDRGWALHQKLAGKPAAAFSSENPGQSAALKEIEKFTGLYGLKEVAPGVTSATAPGPEDLERCRTLGRSLAEAAIR